MVSGGTLKRVWTVSEIVKNEVCRTSWHSTERNSQSPYPVQYILSYDDGARGLYVPGMAISVDIIVNAVHQKFRHADLIRLVEGGAPRFGRRWVGSGMCPGTAL